MKKELSAKEKYADIINLPHHVSRKHEPMKEGDRAIQFAPFAALTGYQGEINETARYTDKKPELDDNLISQINDKLLFLRDRLTQQPEISVTYFKKDMKKSGGSYKTVTGYIRDIDLYKRTLIMSTGELLSIDTVLGIEGNIFSEDDY